MSSRLTYTQLDIRAATDTEYVALTVFSNQLRAERLPDDPPVPVEETIQGCKNIPAQVDVVAWIVRPPGSDEIVAAGHVGIAHFDHNQHIANANIEVLPAFRRRGIGGELLRRIAPVAREANRSLIMCGTCGNIPAGNCFLERIGAHRALESHMNQLKVDELDRAMLADWQSSGRETGKDFDVTIEQGPYRESDLPAVVKLLNDAFNSMPRGELKMEDFTFTPEQIREFERSTFIGGRERWTACARHRDTHEYAGYTEMNWHPNRPLIAAQHGTAILPHFRHKGLGRWLKAAMLDHLLAVHPEIKYIRTDNANMNAAMLEINNALGFKPYQTETSWQIETDKVFSYLDSHPSQEH